MAETSALFLLFVLLLQYFVLTACKKKMLHVCQVSKLRELSFYLTKTPFQLHDISKYLGSEIPFFRQAPTGD